MAGSAETGSQFFDLLKNPGGRPPLQFEQEIKSLRGAAETSYERMQNLEAPGEMSQARSSMLIVLGLRRNALGVVADNIGPALGKEDASTAQDAITAEMKPLVASDSVFKDFAVPEITSVLDDASVGNQLRQMADFVPEPIDGWLDGSELDTTFTEVNPESTEPTPGLHGLELTGAQIGETDLTPGITVEAGAVSPSITIGVLNGGDSKESDVEVTVNVGGTTLSETISEIGAGEEQEVTIPITPVPPSGQTTSVVVTVEDVPGEELTDNNTASYSVTFQ
jgi:hypothetical protein